MATGNYVLDKGYRADSAVVRYTAVAFTGDPETVTQVTSKTDLVAGWAQFGITTAELARGKGASVRVEGITEAVAGGGIDVGDDVAMTDDGKVIAATGSTGGRLVGRCVGHASSNDGDRISMLLNVFGGLDAA